MRRSSHHARNENAFEHSVEVGLIRQSSDFWECHLSQLLVNMIGLQSGEWKLTIKTILTKKSSTSSKLTRFAMISATSSCDDFIKRSAVDKNRTWRSFVIYFKISARINKLHNHDSKSSGREQKKSKQSISANQSRDLRSRPVLDVSTFVWMYARMFT